jgi:beta-mannosidase
MAEGMERLSRFMVGRLGFPVDLKAFVYLTQFNQAEAIRTAVEHWRSRMFRTAGALYWQINDCWPVASWSCLDYYKRKKALYHYTKRFFAPVLPVVRSTDDGLQVTGVSDLRERAEVTVRVRAYGFDGSLLGQQEFGATLHANSATKLGTVALADLGIGHAPRLRPVDIPGCTVPMEGNGALMDAVVYVDITVGDRTYSNYAVFERFRALDLRQPELRTTLEEGRLTLESDLPAFGVVIETENEIDLSDNYLNLEPGRAVTVSLSGDPGVVSVLDLTRLIAKI